LILALKPFEDVVGRDARRIVLHSLLPNAAQLVEAFFAQRALVAPFAQGFALEDEYSPASTASRTIETISGGRAMLIFSTLGILRLGRNISYRPE
jgi:hypothetical protein